MVLVIEVHKLYDKVLPDEGDRKLYENNKFWFCEPENKKKIQNYLKGAGPGELGELATLSFETWKEFETATKEMKSLPGAFYIKEIK